MTLLRKLHLWIGLTLGGALFFTALSGTVLTFKYDLLNLSLAGTAPPYQPPSVAQESRAMAHLVRADTRRLIFPAERLNYYIHVGEKSVEFYHPQSLEQVAGRYGVPETLQFLSDFHIHFLAGRTGEVVLGVFGLFLLFLALSGVILWFPGRRGFDLRKAIPTRVRRGKFLASHRNAGILASGLILLITLTGVGMVFYDVTRDLFKLALQEVDQPAGATEEIIKTPNQPFSSWPEILARVQKTMPDGRITIYDAPQQDGAMAWRFRLRYPEDWTPNGASFLHIDPYTARVIRFQDYRLALQADRLARKLFPLHAGAIGGRVYQMLVATVGLSLMLLIGVAIVAWLRKKKRKKVVRMVASTRAA